ncbi:hypothetical protein [Streptosporangium sp. NPDC049376]|uniref:hypothetical protein n=1 Tax=Streptosporangium sp. NPDC049376 TaxID=3366192 RepID=UPI0037A5E90F
MGFPGEPPRRQPYVQPDGPEAQVPPARGEHWFDPAPQGPGTGERPAETPPYGTAPGRTSAPGTTPGPLPGARPPAPAPDASGPSAPEPPARGQKMSRGQKMWSPYDEGPRSRRPLYVVLGALAVLVAGGVGLTMLVNSDSTPSPGTAAPTRSSSAPVVPQPPGGKFGFAAARKTDPYALTLNELFPRKKVSYGGRSYLMTVRRVDKKCKDAVVGDKLQKALAAGKCTQLLRASFRDASGKIIGTVGVANLKTSAAAAKVVSAGAGKSRKEYLKALPGKDKVTKSLGSGEAFAGGWRHGHYAVMVWFQFKDGHLPKKSEVKRLNQAAFGTVDATVTPALESRSLTGKRP